MFTLPLYFNRDCGGGVILNILLTYNWCIYVSYKDYLRNSKQYKLWGKNMKFDKENTIIIIIIYGIFCLNKQWVFVCSRVVSEMLWG